MFKTILQFTFIFLIVSIVVAFNNSDSRISKYTESKSNSFPKTVSEALIQFGEEKPIHHIEKLDADSARMGEEIVKFGNLLDGSNKRVSKYFVCTDCHNVQIETADPSNDSPEAMLEYGMKNDVPFLPASTFYGMYNKEHWYNDDYFKKYGDLVKPTRDSLYNAIQLCATQCSQGRLMDHWEVRAILHYYKSIELKVSDLNFNKEDLELFTQALSQDKKKATKMIKGKYTQLNHAHFGGSSIPVVEGYEPNVDNGKYIFNSGCLHCHDKETGITNFAMSDDRLSLNFLHRKKNKYNHFAVPHITRYGTYAISGRKQYMPMYSFEKMSNEQMLDLLHYIEVGGVN